MSEQEGVNLEPELSRRMTSEPPSPQDPKPRPPRGFRDQKYVPGKSLPTYTGPYSVGTFELEYAAREPRTFSHITRNGTPLLRLETVLMTVYYPASHDVHSSLTKRAKQSRELWLGRPRLGLLAGYSGFVKLSPALTWPFFVPILFTKLPAYRNAKLAHHWAPAINTKEGGVDVKTKAGEKPSPDADARPTFPLIIFSHGLGGTRTMYSSICGEFASYGFVVCAVEHRDGSGPRTYINNATPSSTATVEAEERKHGYHSVNYLFPKDNPWDTSPTNDKGVDSELRGAQIDLRMAEIEEALECIRLINNGRGVDVAKGNLRRKGAKGASSHGLDGIEWQDWTNRVRMTHITACGHSFGASTVVEMLRHDDRFTKISQGIIYDIWGAGTRPPEPDSPGHRIRVPLLVINSEAFTYWRSNFDLVNSLVKEAHSDPDPAPAWMTTIRGTIHISQSDFTLLYPRICSLLLKAYADPRRAIDLNINASLEFLRLVSPAELAQVSRSSHNENLLDKAVSTLDDIPSLAFTRPKDGFVGARNHIPHETRYRLNPKVYKKKFLARAQQMGDKDPMAESWLFAKPSQVLLSGWLEKQHARVQV
nr:hypothetical protein B0A51_10885 [Rachicladosporium sp. CCFEE 5018]